MDFKSPAFSSIEINFSEGEFQISVNLKGWYGVVLDLKKIDIILITQTNTSE